jgi:hypothetical protein
MSAYLPSLGRTTAGICADGCFFGTCVDGRVLKQRFLS